MTEFKNLLASWSPSIDCRCLRLVTQEPDGGESHQIEGEYIERSVALSTAGMFPRMEGSGKNRKRGIPGCIWYGRVHLLLLLLLLLPHMTPDDMHCNSRRMCDKGNWLKVKRRRAEVRTVMQFQRMFSFIDVILWVILLLILFVVDFFGYQEAPRAHLFSFLYFLRRLHESCGRLKLVCVTRFLFLVVVNVCCVCSLQDNQVALVVAQKIIQEDVAIWSLRIFFLSLLLRKN